MSAFIKAVNSAANSVKKVATTVKTVAIRLYKSVTSSTVAKTVVKAVNSLPGKAAIAMTQGVGDAKISKAINALPNKIVKQYSTNVAGNLEKIVVSQDVAGVQALQEVSGVVSKTAGGSLAAVALGVNVAQDVHNYHGAGNVATAVAVDVVSTVAVVGACAGLGFLGVTAGPVVAAGIVLGYGGGLLGDALKEDWCK